MKKLIKKEMAEAIKNKKNSENGEVLTIAEKPIEEAFLELGKGLEWYYSLNKQS